MDWKARRGGHSQSGARRDVPYFMQNNEGALLFLVVCYFLLLFCFLFVFSILAPGGYDTINVQITWRRLPAKARP